MFPINVPLEIHTDSQASLKAIESYGKEHNERKRLRMVSRTLLQLIHHQIGLRMRSNGSVYLTHVRAHTTDTDIHSVGNRLADYQANLARPKVDRTYPLNLQPLPLQRCELYLHISSEDGQVVINDPSAH